MDTLETDGIPGRDAGQPAETHGSSYLYLSSSRRGFVTGLAKLALGATVATGWLVGFSPSAIAQVSSPHYPCCGDGGCLANPAPIPAGTCMQPCTGLCVNPGTFSCCYYWPAKGYFDCTNCYSGCGTSKVKIHCNASDHSGYFCPVAC
ncbi:MAG: hypothetical protein ACRDFX_01620 [Chloroflexota bacterium]